MDVSQILSLMGILSIGLDEPSPTDAAVFLQFINLAYIEILQETIGQNPYVNKVNDLLDCTNGICSATSQPIFIPKVVYNIAQNLPLTGSTYDEIIKRDPSLSNKNGFTLEWYMSGGSICVYPNVTSLLINGGGIGVRYITDPPFLTALTTSNNIMIPTLYQQVLADGACYYMFQSETGFKDQLKMASAMERWEEGKRKLFAYMVRISGKKIFSTYSPV